MLSNISPTKHLDMQDWEMHAEADEVKCRGYLPEYGISSLNQIPFL